MSAKCTKGTSLLFAFAALAASNAWGQGGPLQQGGAITPGHIPVFSANGVVRDGGSAQNGNATEIGINNTGTPLCIADAPTTGPYHQLCLGANSLGNGLISYQAYNGAPPLNLMCNINGVIVPCELSGTNIQNVPGPLNVVGTLTVGGNITTPGQISAGSITTSDGINAAGGISAASLQTSGNAAIGGNLIVNQPGSVFQQGLVVKAASGQLDALEADGDVQFNSNLVNITGKLTAASAQIGGLDVGSGGLDVAGGIAVSGSAGITGNLTLDGSASMFGLDVGQGGIDVAGGIAVSGDAGITGNTTIDGILVVQGVQVSSDLKLKSDITDFKINGVATLKQLRPVAFRFGNGPIHRGLIADEVQKVLPQAVGSRNGTKTIDPMVLIDVLIVANRELADRIEALEKKVGAH